MDKPHFYSLPKLLYGYKELTPYISEEQLQLHHEKHHQAYVTGANAVFEKLEQGRKAGSDLDMKATLKELSFHIGGHILHSLFWTNLAPAGKGGGGKPSGVLGAAIDKEFGGFERFQKEFTQAAVGAEGSGWAALTFCQLTNRPVIMQIEKHNVNVYPHVLDPPGARRVGARLLPGLQESPGEVRRGLLEHRQLGGGESSICRTAQRRRQVARREPISRMSWMRPSTSRGTPAPNTVRGSRITRPWPLDRLGRPAQAQG